MKTVKVGDIAYCTKSTVITGRNKLPDYSHIVGKTYKIVKIVYDTDLDGLARIDTIYLESEPTTPKGVWGYDYYFFEKNFITLRELRKRKLDKINESR